MKLRNPFPLQFKSIHTGIALAFSCLILCTTAILSYSSYRLSANAVTDNSVVYTSELISQLNTNIQTYIGNMESISALAVSNGDLEKYLSMPDPNSEEAGQLSRQLSLFFESIVKSRSDIASIVFVGTNGTLVSDRSYARFKDREELAVQDWYTKATGAKGGVVISSSHVQHIFQNEYRWVVSISRQLGGETASGRGETGVLLVDLNYNLINNLCKQIHLGQRGYVFILDPSGDIIYHPQQQIIYTGLKSEEIETILQSQDGPIMLEQGNESKMYIVRTNLYGWKIVGVTYPEEMVVNKKEMQRSSAQWGFVCLIIALVISILLSYKLTKPIKNLDAHMKQVEKGNFDIRVDIESINEMGKLARTFNLMIGKIKELMKQIVEEQEMKRISELKALQAQIQPHFLYNTLDSIIWMAETGKMAEVVTMTSALSKLFRSSISKGEELVPISVELEHIRNYLTIQHIRYRNKFTYAIEVDEMIRDCRILKIVLQPLVENAIYHGIKSSSEPGHIRITGTRRAEGMIELQVMDNGVGMTQEKADSLLLKGRPAETGKGVGLANVNHRIQLYFGLPYGLSFKSEPEEGTTVTLVIPELPPGGE